LGSEGRRFITPGYDTAREREKEADEEEAVRLMYVATTRARDRLVLSLYRKKTKSESKAPAAVIDRFATEANCEWHDVDCSQIDTAQISKDDAGTTDAGDTSIDREQWIIDRMAVLKRASRKPAMAVTELAHVNKDEAERGEVYYRKGRGGTSLGRAVHSVLQSIDLATSEGLEVISRAQAAAEGIPHLWEDVAEMAATALQTTVVRRAVASGNYYREIFASVHLENVLIEGYIDLLFEEDDGLVIVDYKTDNVENEAALLKDQERYTMQAGIYAFTVNEVTGRLVREVVLIFLRSGKEISIGNIDVLKLQAKHRIMSIINANGG
jgi:ATP-dependent helicase/nuclease subunit A